MGRILVVADIGNSTIDVGEFHSKEAKPQNVPQPTRTLKLDATDPDFQRLSLWLTQPQSCDWVIGSVNEPAWLRLGHWLDNLQIAVQPRLVSHLDLDLATSVRSPEAVGIDRLAASCAANASRPAGCPIIVVIAGSAITFNMISNQGVFLGGVIMPGIQMSANCLAQQTDKLPSIEIATEPPPLVGDDTDSAIRAGTYWQAVSGVEGLLTRLQQELGGSCDVMATGGSMPMLLPHLNPRIRYEPNLVLSGLAMVAR